MEGEYAQVRGRELPAAGRLRGVIDGGRGGP